MYEKEVMTLGRWDNFDHLESSLTIDELFALYETLKDQELRNFKSTARAMGATFDDEETSEPEGFNDIVQRAAARRGDDLNTRREDFSAIGIGYHSS